MVQAKVTMHDLQELIRKTYLEGLLNNAVILFKDNRMKIEAIGVETDQGIVDGKLTIDINYPCEITEAGDFAINNLGDFLSKLELFERDDIVLISSTTTDVNIIRATPPQTLTYELTDKKFIKTFSTGLKVIFGTPIKLVKLDGKEKIISFDSSVVVDAQKLKEHGAKISKIKANSIPLKIKDGKLITEVKGETSSLVREVEGVTTAIGNATSTYSKNLLTILKMGIGTATLRFSEGTPLHVNFTHESMEANYLLQINDEE